MGTLIIISQQHTLSMKRSLFCTLVLGLAIAFSATGCKHSKKGVTPITGQKATIATPGGSGNQGVPPNLGIGPKLPTDGSTGGTTIGETNMKEPGRGPTGIENTPIEEFAGKDVDRGPLKPYTVYFDYDRSTVRESEKAKLEAVADYMKKQSMDKDLLVEGHCDERGTEEYNRALGERRAQAVREYLVNLGLSAARIQTVSYGKDKPIEPEHNEAAWSKNRRGEFGVLLPKGTAAPAAATAPATPQ